MGICLPSLITKPLDKLAVAGPFFHKGPRFLTYLHAKFASYQKNYLLCAISLEYSAAVKTPKFPSILKSSHQKLLFLHRALQFVGDQKEKVLAKLFGILSELALNLIVSMRTRS